MRLTAGCHGRRRHSHMLALVGNGAVYCSALTIPKPTLLHSRDPWQRLHVHCRNKPNSHLQNLVPSLRSDLVCTPDRPSLSRAGLHSHTPPPSHAWPPDATTGRPISTCTANPASAAHHATTWRGSTVTAARRALFKASQIKRASRAD
jgi:hypothetical protein